MAKTDSNSDKTGTTPSTEKNVVVTPIKMATYRNTTTHKVSIGFQKEFYTVNSGSDIVIPESQCANFEAEHGRTNFWTRVPDVVEPSTDTKSE